MGVKHFYHENFFIFCVWLPYHIIYLISTNKWFVNKIKKFSSCFYLWYNVWSPMVQYEPLVIKIYKCIENVKTRWDNNKNYHCHCHCHCHCNQANYENMSISKKWSLVSIEPLNPNSKKVEGLYKSNNFINNIAFGTALFVFCDLNTYFQL